MAQLVVGVESTGEHCSALAKEHSVVDPQGKSKAGRREGNCCGHQLHRLAAMAKPPTSTVAALASMSARNWSVARPTTSATATSSSSRPS